MPLDLSRVKALCFDVDGTLSDTDELYSIRIARFLPRFLFRDPAHTARRLVMWAEAPGNALLGMADTLGLDDAMTAVIDWISRHRKFPDDELLLIPGVDVLLSQLHGSYPLAVVSARDKKATMRFLERFDLVKFFDVIVTGLSARHTKPYPDPILFAAQKMGVRPEECLMVGDTTVDMRAGKLAAAQTIGVLCGFGEEEELLRLGADYIVKNTADLADILLDKK